MTPRTEQIHLPKAARIEEVIVENSQIRTFVLSFTDPAEQENFTYLPGQFMMVSVPHHGEAPISFSSTPSRPGSIELSVRRAGKLTTALHGCKPGDRIGLRGPYGRPFPLAELATRELLFVAGGIGLAPLRSLINHCLDHAHPGRIEILYGSRSPDDIAFGKDLDAWQQAPDVRCRLIVDQGNKEWRGRVGMVTSLLPETGIEPRTGAALVCGPPLMIRSVMAELAAGGFHDERIITTMERHMKCGIGTCGHCHLDGRLVCTHGPVFNRRELRDLEIPELS